MLQDGTPSSCPLSDSQSQSCCSANLIDPRMLMAAAQKRAGRLEVKEPLCRQRWASRKAAGLAHMEKWASQGDPSVFMRVRMAGSQKGKRETEAWVPQLCAGHRGIHAACLSWFHPPHSSVRKEPSLLFPFYRLGNWRSKRLATSQGHTVGELGSSKKTVYFEWL